MSVTLRPLNRPLNRQPFRPGQWQGARIGTKHTTYIQNNFFGSSYGNYSNYGTYGGYCNHDSGMSKGMKWMLGLGLGTTLLGGILKMFGVGGKDEAGAVDDKSDEPTKPLGDNDNDQKLKEEKPQGETVEVKPQGDEDVKEKAGFKWNDLSNMICRDASGKTQNISGSFSITQAGAEGEPPQQFTITDSSSGTPHTYTYELTGKSSDGKPVYTCKSMNGQAANTANQYTLEMNDGKPELVQYSNQDNFSKGLKFGSISSGTEIKSASTTNTNPTATKEKPEETTDNEKIYDGGELPEVVVTPKPDGKKVGKQVADDLVGYTNDSEKQRVIENISNNIDSTNIVDFLESYKENKGLGDSIIKQINTEYGWTNQEKVNSQKQILSSLLERANEAGVKLSSNEQTFCDKFLNMNADTTKLGNNAADQLDKIINKLLEELKPKPGSFGGGEGGGGGAGSTF